MIPGLSIEISDKSNYGVNTKKKRDRKDEKNSNPNPVQSNNKCVNEEKSS